ncbi:MAG: hypothetical protein EXR86_16445 [Gammaproteobacteria bacterium]|nr:hypothetical protein [Gammaproteobacteria bacterium]
MAEQSSSKGFSLPIPGQSTGVDKSSSGTTTPSIQIGMPQTNALDGPEPRDYAIAGAVLAVLLIAFFFVRGAYANHLVGKKVSPNSANAAGWWLFIFLTGLAMAAVMAILSPVKFLAPLFMAPLGLVSVVALILMLITGRRR